jgi:hypothetical protein
MPRRRSQNARAGPDDARISIPISRPLPRTSSTCGLSIACNSDKNHAPSSSARATSPSSSSTASAARPIAHASGLPPNVDP